MSAQLAGGVAGLIFFVTASAAAVEVATPTTRGVPRLELSVDAAGKVRVNQCLQAACSPATAMEVVLPADARGALGTSRLAKVPLGGGRFAVHLRVPLAQSDAGEQWEGLWGAGADGKPRALFAGYTGFSAGTPGERRGERLDLTGPQPDGSWRVLRGEVREDVSLCGRSTLLVPSALWGTASEWKPVKLQRVSEAERTASVELKAEPVGAEVPALSPGALRATVASSAVGNPSALTDGDGATSWAEGRSAEGRGEFVVFQGASELPVDRLDLTLPALSGAQAAPRLVYLVSDGPVYRVELPAPPVQAAARRFRLTLPAPLHTSCLSLVLDSSWGKSKEQEVAFAEVAAGASVSDLRGKELVAALENLESRSAMVEALRLRGTAGRSALLEVHGQLSRGAQAEVTPLLGLGDCETTVPTLVASAASDDEALQVAAVKALVACAPTAQPALEAALAGKVEASTPRWLSALGAISPAKALEVGLLLQRRSGGEVRVSVREALAEQLRAPQGAEAGKALLVDPKVPSADQLELLRAWGPGVRAHQALVEGILARLAASPELRERYLRLEPAAQLGPQSARARSLLAEAALRDPSPMVRTRAVELSDDVAALATVGAAFRDDEVRVRLAAVEAAGRLKSQATAPDLRRLLLQDPWPMVRVEAANGLGVLRTGAAELREASDDDAWRVRVAALVALGPQADKPSLELLREKLEDEEERPEVRAAAARGLGLACDFASVEILTEYARKAADPMAGEPWGTVSPAALLALEWLHPSDLKARLEPLLDPKAAAGARQAAELHLSRPGRCPAGAPGGK